MKKLKKRILIGPFTVPPDPSALGFSLYAEEVHCFTQTFYADDSQVNVDSVMPFQGEALSQWIQKYVIRWEPELLIWLDPIKHPVPYDILQLALQKVALGLTPQASAAVTELCSIYFNARYFSDTFLRVHEGASGARKKSLLPLEQRHYDFTFIYPASIFSATEAEQIQRLFEMGGQLSLQCLSENEWDRASVLQQSKLVCIFNVAQKNAWSCEAISAGALLCLMDVDAVSQIVEAHAVRICVENTDFEQHIVEILSHINRYQSRVREGHNAMQSQYAVSQLEHLFTRLDVNLQADTDQLPNTSFTEQARLYLRYLKQVKNKAVDAHAFTWLEEHLHRIKPEDRILFQHIQLSLFIQHLSLGILHSQELFTQRLSLPLTPYLKVLKQMISQHPHPALFFNLGVCFLLLQQPAQAEQAFARAQKATVQFPLVVDDVWYDFLIVLPPYKAFDRLLQFSGTRLLGLILHMLADVYYVSHKNQAAQNYYEQLIVSCGDSPIALKRLSKFCVLNQQLKPGLQFLQRYLRYCPEDLNMWKQLVVLVHATGNPSLAKLLLSKAKAIAYSKALPLNDLEMMELNL